MSQPFAGFALPTSNTTYTPNQFFDVCLPHYSRGTIRLVSFLIRKTLGWSDEQGHPQAERHAVSYADFERAGISRDMIHSAIDDAIKGHFIRCVRAPQAKGLGKVGISGLYELQWDEGAEYIKAPQKFRGFFAGEGNRTYIPNQFFDEIVPTETLAVVKVVGAVTRFSIGFANKWGHRRRNTALSYLHIQRYSSIKNRSTISSAIQHAIKSNYIERVEEGYFDPDGGKLSKTAVYALKWSRLPLNAATDETIGQKSGPAKIDLCDRSEKRTGIGQKSGPEDRSEKRTGLEITIINNNSKQQAVAPSNEKQGAAIDALQRQGFDRATAEQLATQYSIDRVLNQIEWMERRRVQRNRLGMLRLAIEQDWAKPDPMGKSGRPDFSPRHRPIVDGRNDLVRKFQSPYQP